MNTQQARQPQRQKFQGKIRYSQIIIYNQKPYKKQSKLSTRINEKQDPIPLLLTKLPKINSQDLHKHQTQQKYYK